MTCKLTSEVALLVDVGLLARTSPRQSEVWLLVYGEKVVARRLSGRTQT